MKQTIYQMEHSSIEFKKTHTVNIGGMPKEGKPPKYFIDFKNEMMNFVKEQKEFNLLVLDFIKEQRKFNQYVLDVFKRNNLFQQEVIDQFKKHGWTK